MTYYSIKPSTEKQQKQRKLRHALGYSIGIRGYLLYWRGLVKEIQDPVDRFQAERLINDMISSSKYIEASVRKNLRKIK